ncbi:MAG: hypothetical protein KBA26_14515 [Candidatus Delongbacteria bacterium]|nr:hypothetical protein [Candidatus Delongbacteria bacterium]
MTDVQCLKRYGGGAHDRPTLLYAGDDDLDRAAVYLSSIIYSNGYNFDYIPSPSPFPSHLELERYALIILSDYPARNFSEIQLKALVDYARRGGSVLMIGGWESYTGLMNEYTATPLADILPVSLESNDDRRNLPQGCVVVPAFRCTEKLKTLDWMAPPLIGGYNQITPRTRSTVHLIGKKLVIGNSDGLQLGILPEEIPLLVSKPCRKGFAAALAFDLAPHWIGGMVDWGLQRRRIDFNDGFIEVGDLYLDFVSKLLSFAINKGE